MATTEQYLNKLIEQKNTLADNLVEKGVSATHDETLETLVPKVLDIVGGSEINNIVKWQYAVFDTNGFLDNVLAVTNTDGCKLARAFSDAKTDGLVLYKSYSGYNITHSDAIDFTQYKKVIIHGLTVANTSSLTTVASAQISNEELTSIDQQWVQLNSSKGTALADFTTEIDCTNIVGKQNLYLGVTHGTESAMYTSYVYIYDIVFE